MKIFSKLPNKLFYSNEGESILKKVKDDKVIVVLHYLNMLVNRLDIAVTTVDYLIEKCGYAVNKDSRKNFKNILFKLKEEKLIDFEYDDFKASQLLEIKILEVEEFIMLEQEELDMLDEFSTSQKQRINIIKLYCYLKARTYKKKKEDEYLDGGKAQVCYPSYKTISSDTGISEGAIKEYIEWLKKLEMIDYRSAGYMYLESDKNKVRKACSNIYTVTKVSGIDEENRELKEGLKQYKEAMKRKGYIVVNNVTAIEEVKNGRKLGGKITQLRKKRNLGTATYEELELLENYEESKEFLN